MPKCKFNLISRRRRFAARSSPTATIPGPGWRWAIRSSSPKSLSLHFRLLRLGPGNGLAYGSHAEQWSNPVCLASVFGVWSDLKCPQSGKDGCLLRSTLSREDSAVQAMHPVARIGYWYLLSDAWQTDDCTIPSDPIDLADKSGLGDELSGHARTSNPAKIRRRQRGRTAPQLCRVRTVARRKADL